MYGNNYGFTIGHAYENKDNPDNINGRKELYLYYVDKLIDVLSVKYVKNKTNYNKIDVKQQIEKIIVNTSKNIYICKSIDAILSFECGYYANKGTSSFVFYISGKDDNEFNSILEYISQSHNVINVKKLERSGNKITVLFKK